MNLKATWTRGHTITLPCSFFCVAVFFTLQFFALQFVFALQSFLRCNCFLHCSFFCIAIFFGMAIFCVAVFLHCSLFLCRTFFCVSDSRQGKPMRADRSRACEACGVDGLSTSGPLSLQPKCSSNRQSKCL